MASLSDGWRPHAGSWIAISFFCACVLFAIGAAVHTVARTAGFNLLGNPELLLSPSPIELGQVPANQTITVTVRVINSGGGNLRVANVKGSCDACVTIVEYPQGSIPAGEAGRLTLAVATGNNAGKARKQVVIQSNDWKEKPYVLDISWTNFPENTPE